jgi:hypothetical protein
MAADWRECVQEATWRSFQAGGSFSQERRRSSMTFEVIFGEGRPDAFA